MTTGLTLPEKWEPNHVGQNYLLLDRQANIATGETYSRRVFQIVSEAGRSDGAQVSINFDPSYQTPTIHHLQLIRGGQVTDRFDPAKVQILQREQDLDRQLYNGERSALIILDDVRVGDIIDLAYTLKGRNPVFGDHFIDLAYLGWAVPVQELRYRVLQPTGRTFAHQIRGDSPGAPARRTTEFGEELLWVRRNLPAIEGEDKTPNWHVVYPFLEVSDFGSWASVVEWALPLYALESTTPPLVRETADHLRQSAATPEARALAALRFVQEEVRYLGIEMGPGSHRPSAPEDVLQRRFGDCKDKSRLLVALLRELGLEASPALVNSSLRDSVKLWLPSPYAFDHVIVALHLAGRSYLLDPTMSYQRGDTLARRHVGIYGPYLQLAPGVRNLATAAWGESDSYQTEIKETFRTTAFDQPSELTVVSTYRGTSADSLRAYFATRSREQIGREYLDYYTRYYSDVSLARPVDFTDDSAHNTVTVTEYYQIKALFSSKPNSPVLLAEFYPAVLDDYLRIPNLGQRKYPYALTHPARVSCETTLLLPDTWQIEDFHQTIRDPAFEFEDRVQGFGTKIVLNYQWRSLAAEVPLDRLAAFSAHVNEARALLGYQLTYNPAVAAGSGYALNWAMILLAVVVTAVSGVVSWQLLRRRNPAAPPPLLDPGLLAPTTPGAPATAPEGLGGWLILVAIGLFSRPFMLLAVIVDSHGAYFNHAVWQELTTPGGTAYQPHYAVIGAVELACNLGLMVFAITLIALFFRRSYLFPRAIQAFFFLQVLVAVFGVWAMNTLTTVSADDRAEAIKTLAQTCLAAVIWVPYFYISRRVRRTFIR